MCHRTRIGLNWEAIHILDGLLENRSDIRPDTLHADTQGQSEPVFGLAYLLAMRRTINAATNTVESWNGFVQWAAFGGEGIMRQNNREEQRKIIRYNPLVANLVVFHNVVSMTRGLQELVDEG